MLFLTGRLRWRTVCVAMASWARTPVSAEFRQVLDDLNHRLRYVLVEYDEPIAPIRDL